jgi:hypothetical protein
MSEEHLLRGGKRCKKIAISMAAAALLAGVTHRTLANPVVLTPRLSVGEQYNDNIFFDTTHREDYVTTVSPGLTLNYRSPRATTFLSGSTTSTWFARHTQQDQTFDSQYGTLGTSYDVSPRLTLTVNDSVTHVHETRTTSGALSVPGAPPPEAQPPGPATEASTLLPRGEVFSNFFAGAAAYRLTPLWTGTLTYSNALNDFTNPGGHELTNAALLSLGYAWTPVLSLSTYYSYSRLDARVEPGTESHGAGVGAGYQFGETWWFNGTAGFYVNRPIGSGSDSISTGTGPTANLVLTKTFAHSTAQAGVSQQVTTSAGIAGTSQTRNAFLGYSITLLPHLTASVSPSFSDFNTSESDFRVLQVPATLSYTFWKYFSATLSYAYRYQDTSQTVPGVVEQGAVDGNLVQLYVTASYAVWRGSL